MSDAPRGWNWILVQAGLFLLILLVPRFPNVSFPFWLRISGWVLVAIAAYLGSGGLLALGDSLSIFPKPKKGSRLVRSGPYRLVRHPIYGALVLATLGWSFWRQHLPGLILGLILVIFFDRKSRHEERLLRARYEAYAEFCKDTPRRMIPWVY